MYLLTVLYQLLKGRSIEESPAYNEQKMRIIVETIERNIAISATIAILALLIWKKKRTWFVRAALLLTIVELFIFSRGNLITIPLKIVQQPNEVSQWLARKEENTRFFSTSDNLPYTGLSVYWTHLRAREPFSPNKLTSRELKNFQRFRHELQVVPQNQGIPAKVQDASGYAALVPQSYLRFWQENPPSPNSVAVDDLKDPKLNVVGVKFFITGYPQDYIDPLDEERFQLVYEANGVRVYENTEAWPRAFLLKGGEPEAAEITKYEPTHVSIQAESRETAELVLTDTHYPGWIAKVDGREVPIEKYQGTFRQITVPEGKHEVEFLYKPKSVKVGAIISLTTLFGVAVVWLWKRKQRLQSSS